MRQKVNLLSLCLPVLRCKGEACDSLTVAFGFSSRPSLPGRARMGVPWCTKHGEVPCCDEISLNFVF